MNNTLAYARLHDPATSWEAAESVSENTLSRSQNAVLGFIMARGNCTQQEAEDFLTRHAYFTPERVRSAFTELERLNKIERTSLKRKTRSGRNATVWMLTKYENQEGIF